MAELLFRTAIGFIMGVLAMTIAIDLAHVDPCEAELPRSQTCKIIAVPRELEND